MTQYTLRNTDFQNAYKQIQDLANAYPEKSKADSFEPLSSVDFVQYAAKNNTFGLIVYDEENKKLKIFDPDVIQNAYRLLVQLDESDGALDGVIQNPQAIQNLELFQDSPAISFNDDLANQWRDFYKNSIFTLTVTTAPYNSTSTETYATLVRRTKLPNGSYSYLLVTDRRSANNGTAVEIKYSLQSLSQEYRFDSGVTLLGCDTASQIAVFELITTADLPVILSSENRLRAGTPVMQLNQFAITGRVIDPVRWLSDPIYDLPSNPFAFARINLTQRGDIHGFNKGAPVLNQTGELLGVVLKNETDPVDNTLFIPVATLNLTIDSILKNSNETQGAVYSDWGIVNFQPFNGKNDPRLNILPDGYYGGVIITKINVDSPAMKAGLQPLDVIVSVDNDPDIVDIYLDEVGKLWNYILTNSKPVKITYWRPNINQVFTTTLYPENYKYNVTETFATKAGFTVNDIAPKNRSNLNLPSNIQGVIVNTLTTLPIGVSDNFIITAIGSSPTPSVAEFKLQWEQNIALKKPFTISLFDPATQNWSLALIDPSEVENE